MAMSETLLDELKADIDERQEALNAVQVVLDSKANLYSDLAKWFRIAVIFLGALVATREVADKLFPVSSYPSGSKVVLVLYTIFGLAIAVIGGITAAFRYETKSAELRVLAVKCNSHALDIDGKLPKKGDTSPPDQQIAAARELITLQNTCLSELQGKAAELGLDIVRKVRRITSSRTSA
jgi:hypothetical protein